MSAAKSPERERDPQRIVADGTPRESGWFPKGSGRTRDDPLARLAASALAGNVFSERQLVEQLTPTLLRFLKRTTPPEGREDFLQDGLLAVLGALPDFREESSLLRFSIGVVRRSSRAQRRASRRYREHMARAAELELPLAVDAEASEDSALAALRRGELAKLLSGLPARQRQALVLRVLFDFSLAEVAAEAKVSINTVRTRVRLARRRLRARIAEDAVLRELFAR